MDTEISAAHEARVRYLEPVSLHDPDGLYTRVPPEQSLEDSYRWQQHTRLRDDLRVVLRPAMVGEAPEPNHFPGHDALWLVTAWNAHGRLSDYEANVRASTRLRGRVESLGGHVLDTMTTTPATRAWVEDTLLIAGIEEAVAVALAVEFGQPALTRWTKDALTTVPTASSPALRGHSQPWALARVPLACPMLLDDAQVARCAVRGGPWVSAAINASMIWYTHRRLLLPRLGCALCEDGTVAPLGSGGSPISTGLSVLALGSRYGGYVWTHTDASERR